jgi:hypothetical protein
MGSYVHWWKSPAIERRCLPWQERISFKLVYPVVNPLNPLYSEEYFALKLVVISSLTRRRLAESVKSIAEEMARLYP